MIESVLLNYEFENMGRNGGIIYYLKWLDVGRIEAKIYIDGYVVLRYINGEEEEFYQPVSATDMINFLESKI